jgi:hypothetical protein
MSLQGSNPCTATNHFNKLNQKSRGANVVQKPLAPFFLTNNTQTSRNVFRSHSK